MWAEEKIARLLTNHYDILRSSQQLMRHFTTAAGSPLLLPPGRKLSPSCLPRMALLMQCIMFSYVVCNCHVWITDLTTHLNLWYSSFGDAVTQIENILTYWSVAQAGSNDQQKWRSKISLNCPFNRLNVTKCKANVQLWRVHKTTVVYYFYTFNRFLTCRLRLSSQHHGSQAT